MSAQPSSSRCDNRSPSINAPPSAPNTASRLRISPVAAGLMCLCPIACNVNPIPADMQPAYSSAGNTCTTAFAVSGMGTSFMSMNGVQMKLSAAHTMNCIVTSL